MSKNHISLSINDNLFDDVRLDILNWINSIELITKAELDRMLMYDNNTNPSTFPFEIIINK